MAKCELATRFNCPGSSGSGGSSCCTRCAAYLFFSTFYSFCIVREIQLGACNVGRRHIGAATLRGMRLRLGLPLKFGLRRAQLRKLTGSQGGGGCGAA